MTSIISEISLIKCGGGGRAVQLNISLAQSSSRQPHLINEPKVWRSWSEIASILCPLKREKCQLFHLLSDSSCHRRELMSAFGDLWCFSFHIKCRLRNTDTWKTSCRNQAGWKKRSEHVKQRKENTCASEPLEHFNDVSLFRTGVLQKFGLRFHLALFSM